MLDNKEKSISMNFKVLLLLRFVGNKFNWTLPSLSTFKRINNILNN